MDPNETLARIIDAACNGEADALEDFSTALARWLWRGGFAPTNPVIPNGSTHA